MPKTLIVHAPSQAAASLSAALADGARAVRFAEVDVRAADALDTLTGYDAVVVDAAAADRLAALLGASGALGDTVAATFGGDDASRWATLRALAGAGCLLVPPADDLASLGRRVATVAEWVRHAKSHHHHH